MLRPSLHREHQLSNEEILRKCSFQEQKKLGFAFPFHEPNLWTRRYEKVPSNLVRSELILEMGYSGGGGVVVVVAV